MSGNGVYAVSLVAGMLMIAVGCRDVLSGYLRGQRLIPSLGVLVFGGMTIGVAIMRLIDG